MAGHIHPWQQHLVDHCLLMGALRRHKSITTVVFPDIAAVLDKHLVTCVSIVHLTLLTTLTLGHSADVRVCSSQYHALVRILAGVLADETGRWNSRMLDRRRADMRPGVTNPPSDTVDNTNTTVPDKSMPMSA